MIICVTGTPATGKTTLSRLLALELRHKYVDVKKLIKEKKLYDCYEGGEYIVDTKKLSKFLAETLRGNAVVDSLFSHYLPKKKVGLCVVMKCGLKELKKRLEKRKYSKEKVRENMDAEIFDVCLNEAKDKGHYTFVINTTKGIKKETVSQLLGEINAIKSTSRRAK